MLCAFSGPPRNLRLHGRGEVLLAGDDGFADLLAQAAFEEHIAQRNATSIDGLAAVDPAGPAGP